MEKCWWTGGCTWDHGLIRPLTVVVLPGGGIRGVGSDFQPAEGVGDQGVAFAVPQQDAIELVALTFSDDSVDATDRRIR
ncbi:hypothetical protein K8O92_20350 [Nocardia asteroides]|nr:hypothetical protein K8O92_20350 [Nocardia asteroides]